MTQRMIIPCTDLTMVMLAKHGFHTLDGKKVHDLPMQEGPFATCSRGLHVITARVSENDTLGMVQVIVECPQEIPTNMESDLLTCVNNAAIKELNETAR
jgi:hypothetical protein